MSIMSAVRVINDYLRDKTEDDVVTARERSNLCATFVALT